MKISHLIADLFYIAIWCFVGYFVYQIYQAVSGAASAIGSVTAGANNAFTSIQSSVGGVVGSLQADADSIGNTVSQFTPTAVGNSITSSVDSFWETLTGDPAIDSNPSFVNPADNLQGPSGNYTVPPGGF